MVRERRQEGNQLKAGRRGLRATTTDKTDRIIAHHDETALLLVFLVTDFRFLDNKKTKQKTVRSPVPDGGSGDMTVMTPPTLDPP